MKDIEKEYNNLIEKEIKSHLKHFNLKVKNGFIYKKDLVIYTENLNDRIGLVRFLEGLSCVMDSLDFWNLEYKK